MPNEGEDRWHRYARLHVPSFRGRRWRTAIRQNGADRGLRGRTLMSFEISTLPSGTGEPKKRRANGTTITDKHRAELEGA